MTPRERLLTVLDNGKPDRLPGHVHSWMPYYLDNYLGGCDQYEAYRRFGMDMALIGQASVDGLTSLENLKAVLTA